MHWLLLLTVFVHSVWSEYNCVCFYDVERKVFSSPSVTSTELGFMYEFDCKQALSTNAPTGWAEIAFQHQVGYIQTDANTKTQICTGLPPDTDQLASTMPPTTMASTTMQPKAMTTNTMRTTTMQPTTMQPTTMQPTTMQPTTMQPTTMQPATMESTTMQQTTMQPTTMQPTTMESTTMQPTTTQPTTMQPTTMESTTMQQTTMQPTTIPPTTMASTTMQRTTVPTTPTASSFAMSSTPDMTSPTMAPYQTTQMSGEGCPLSVQQEAKVNNSLLIVNHLEHKCYEFVQTKHYWTTSENYCKRHGGHLATIRNDNENKAIYEYVKAYGHSVWIGFNDKVKEDTFTWTSGNVFVYKLDNVCPLKRRPADRLHKRITHCLFVVIS
ncbi:hypothetical protein ACF0H5_019963 [Mactra antiquata]